MILKPTDCNRHARNLCSSGTNAQSPAAQLLCLEQTGCGFEISDSLYYQLLLSSFIKCTALVGGEGKKNPRTYSNYLTRRHQGEIKRRNVFKKSARSSAMPLMCVGKRGECPQTLDLSDVTQLPLDYRPLVSTWKKRGSRGRIITCYCQAQTSG